MVVALHSAADIVACNDVKIAKEMIKDNLVNSNQWLFRGLLAIFARQTVDEQSSEQTELLNGIGFNATDSEILSSFAKQVLRWNATPVAERLYKSPLSPKQIELARKKMLKYAGQLYRIATEPKAVTV